MARKKECLKCKEIKDWSFSYQGMCGDCNDEKERLEKEGKCDICQKQFSVISKGKSFFFSPELVKTEIGKAFQKLISSKAINKNLGEE